MLAGKCGIWKQLSSGDKISLKSPNYPRPYTNLLTCTWFFTSSQSQIGSCMLTFVDFETDEGFDYLNIGAGEFVNMYLPNVIVLSGYRFPSRVYINEKVIWLELVTDDYFGLKGFHILLEYRDFNG